MGCGHSPLERTTRAHGQVLAEADKRVVRVTLNWWCVTGTSIGLLMIDEVHILSDDRGSCLEGLVTRFVRAALQLMEISLILPLRRCKMMQKIKKAVRSTAPIATIRMIALRYIVRFVCTDFVVYLQQLVNNAKRYNSKLLRHCGLAGSKKSRIWSGVPASTVRMSRTHR